MRPKITDGMHRPGPGVRCFTLGGRLRPGAIAAIGCFAPNAACRGELHVTVLQMQRWHKRAGRPGAFDRAATEMAWLVRPRARRVELRTGKYGPGAGG